MMYEPGTSGIEMLRRSKDDDKETWGFLKVMFEDDGTSRIKLLNHLALNLPA
ncbi:hypothetical protein M8C21_005049, partial [Ambrosia artemisiifolia]